MAHYGMTQNLTPEELHGWLRLAVEPGVGRATARNLLAEFGLPQHLFAAAPSALARHMPQDTALRLASPPSSEVSSTIEAALEALSRPGHHLLTLADPQYPKALLDSSDPPLLLFVRGRVELLHQPAVAIVGSRSATEGGKDDARAFSRYLASRGWIIISGLARGIDAAAHEGALDTGEQGGGTIAVLASGLDTIYPRQHQALAEKIAQTGALITEYPCGTPATPYRFPDRNRVIAALARGVLVVEAAMRSGSLLTAKLAAECGREVFAIPGSIHAPLSRGCHALIRQGAKLVEQGRDIEEELIRAGPVPQRTATHGNDQSDAAPCRQSAARRPANRIMKDPTVERVLEALGYDPADIELLCHRSGLAFSRVAAILTELELNDIVQRLDDGRYLRRQQGIIYG